MCIVEHSRVLCVYEPISYFLFLLQLLPRFSSEHHNDTFCSSRPTTGTSPHTSQMALTYFSLSISLLSSHSLCIDQQSSSTVQTITRNNSRSREIGNQSLVVGCTGSLKVACSGSGSLIICVLEFVARI